MRPGRRALLALAATAALLAACGGEQSGGADPDQVAATPGTARTIAVPGDAETVQAAVDQARPGDLVLVEPGTYAESVVIETEGVTLRGTERNTVVLDGGGQMDDGVVVRADGVAVENLTVREFRFNGVLITGDEEGGTLTGYRASHLTVHANGRHGLHLVDARGGLVEAVWASGHDVAGIAVQRCSPCRALIRGVTAVHNAVGLQATNAGGELVVTGSTFRDNRVGIRTASSSLERLAPQHDATIAGNVVVDNGSPLAPGSGVGFGIGMSIGGGTSNLVEANRVEGNSAAGVVVLDQEPYLADSNVVRRNELAANGVDLVIATGSPLPRGNCFAGNRFATSDPPEIEVLFACAPESRGGRGQLRPDDGPAPAGSVAEPPPQPSMPEPQRLPDGPASDVPPAVDLLAIEVPDQD